MSGLLKTIATRAGPVVRGPTVTQKATVYTRPPKDTVGPAETAIGLGMFALAILGPAGWILANLDSYKSKD